MKKLLNIGLAIMTPLGIAGGLAYKIIQGEIADPVFFILLVIIPSTLIASIKQIRAMLPPDKIKINFQEGVRAKHWEQASSWTTKRTRKVTSLYIPLRIENHDPEKDVLLYDVEVRDKITQVLLNPPQPSEIKIGQERKWCFLGCGYALEKIFNSGRTVVPKASVVDVAIMIQENEIHRDTYELEIKFKDNYGRQYSLTRRFQVKDFSSWDVGITE